MNCTCERCNVTEEKIKKHLLTSINNIIFKINTRNKVYDHGKLILDTGMLSNFRESLKTEMSLINSLLYRFNSDDKFITISLWNKFEGEYYDKLLCYHCSTYVL